MSVSSPRVPILYPKHFNQYLLCPEQYFHDRIERRRVPQSFSPALAKGIAAHQVLASIAADYEAFLAANGVPAVPCDLRERVQALLPRAPYPSDYAWEVDVAAVIEQIKHGIAYLDGEARVLSTEATYQYPHKGDAVCPPFVLAAKVDLVLLRQDQEGRPFLDVVDWKGGANARPDLMQELAGRIVVKKNAARLLDVEPAYVQTTTVYLGAQSVRSTVIEYAECVRRWAEMRRVAKAIIEGTDWRPSPSPLCEYCAYFRDGCSLAAIDGDDDSEDWLTSVAD